MKYNFIYSKVTFYLVHFTVRLMSQWERPFNKKKTLNSKPTRHKFGDWIKMILIFA